MQNLGCQRIPLPTGRQGVEEDHEHLHTVVNMHKPLSRKPAFV